MAIALERFPRRDENQLLAELLRTVRIPFWAFPEPKKPLVALVCKRRIHHDDGDSCNYQLVKTYRVKDGISQQWIANLGEFNDLGELSAPEIALEEVKKRLEVEESHQHFQEQEFARGWYRSGPMLNRTRRYTPRYMREQRAKAARHIEQLKEQIRQLERAVARYPTPPDVLEILREQYEKTRLEAARKFQEWEAELINDMVQKR